MENHFFCVCHFKQNFGLLESVDPKQLPLIMARLSKDNAYAQTQNQYTHFCQNVFQTKNTDCFQAVFLAIDAKSNQCIGFLNVQVVFECAEIEFIFVSETHQGHGVGFGLICMCEEKLKQHQIEKQIEKMQMTLEVGAQNKKAISFYEKNGFFKIGIRQKYYKQTEDAVLMQKEIVL